MKSTNEHYSRRVCYDRSATVISHSFYSHSEAWATNIEFRKETADIWIINNKHTQDASINQNKDPLLEFRGKAIGMREWKCANHEERSQFISSRQHVVRRAKRIATSIYCKKMRIEMRKALRCNDISAWARRIRPSIRKSHGFFAAWYQPTHGATRRATDKTEATIGAAQEWEMLMRKPSHIF